MSDEVSVVSAHLFIEKVSAQCEQSFYRDFLSVCGFSLLRFFISVTHKKKTS